MNKLSMYSLEQILSRTRDGNISPMYLYATEMVSSYYHKIGVDGKRVLTVCGSGDQIFDAYLAGASEVVCFDKNILSKHLLRLKIAAIKGLTRKEFLSFFGTGHSDAVFEYDTYRYLPLPISTKSFFDELYAYMSYDSHKLARSSFFHQREFWCKQVNEINHYLNSDQQYTLLQTMLSRKITFICSELNSVIHKVNGKFDFINLSNIPDYLTKYSYSQTNESVVRIYNKVLRPLKEILNNDGTLFYYNYSKKPYPHKDALYKERPIMSKPETINQLRELTEFRIRTFKVKGIFSGFDTLVCLQNLV